MRIGVVLSHIVLAIAVLTTAWPGLFGMLAFFSLGLFLALIGSALMAALAWPWVRIDLSSLDLVVRPTPSTRGRIASTMLAFVWVGLFVFNVPLRVGFALNRPHLEQLRAQAAGLPPWERQDVSSRVGMYPITSCMGRGDAIGVRGEFRCFTYFSHGACMMGSVYGFAHYPHGTPRMGRYELIELSDGWYYFCESYS